MILWGGAMYRLTLSKHDRKAIDWIGHRYFHGNEFYEILMECDFEGEWDSDESITFLIPEHKAWEIKEGFESEDNLLPCFRDSLRIRLLRWVENIV